VRPTVIAALLATAAFPAYALQVPEIAPNVIDHQPCGIIASAQNQPTQANQANPNWQRTGCDPHARIAVFRQHESVLLVGAVGRPMSVTFAPDETVFLINFDMPPGIDSPWQSLSKEQLEQLAQKDQDLGNVLPLWAMREGRSSLQVITNSDVGKRVYLFQLVALKRQPDTCAKNDCDDENLMTGVSFVYPDDVKRAAAKKGVIDRQALMLAKAEDRLKQDTFSSTQACVEQSKGPVRKPTECNFKFTIKGKPSATQSLGPDELIDNGRDTVFVYYGNREVPLISIPQPYGPPRQVTPEPGKLGAFIVHETARQWLLTKGQEAAWINNVGYDPEGVNDHTGTTSRGVVRIVKTSGP